MKQTYTMKQSHTLRRTLSAIILCLASTLAWAQTFEVDGIYYKILDATSVGVTKGKATLDEGGHLVGSYSGDIVIPAIVRYNDKTYIVTRIENSAFQDCSSLTFIVIPESVTSIGGSAFEGCTSLTSIDLPDRVTKIENTG